MASRFVACMPLVGLLVFGWPAYGEDADIDALKEQMKELMRRNEEQQRQIDRLQRQIEALEARPAPTAAPVRAAQPAATPPRAGDAALDEALGALGVEPTPAAPARPPAAAGGDLFARRVGGVELRLLDLSFDVLAAAGSSTVGGDTLRDLEAGAHDPNRRGFTFQNGEIGLTGAVDPYFSGQAFLVATDSDVELEEAYFTTASLPYDLQVKGGYFLTDFGRINPQHPHAWAWQDQPVINTRLFGGEGLRAPGIEASWLAPLPWFAQLTAGMQDGDEGELTTSFLDDEGGVGGRPAVDTGVHALRDFVYLARWANSWDVTPEVSALIGVSGLYGANATGASGDTVIYGTDLTFKWRPATNFRGWPFVAWQSEVMKRDYTADAVVTDDPTADLPRAILRDYGFYSQLLWGFAHPWAAGVRFEFATGTGRSVVDGVLTSRQADPFRGDRFRFTPLLAYHPSEFSRLRLQYDFDHATFLDDGDAHSVWLGIEFLYGAHPAHRF